MIYSEFKDKKLSLLGFGTMRLPLLPDGRGEVDEEQVARMVRYAADHGINYYDTAYPYHNSKSEVIIGKALKQLPRESFYLATKYPGHQIAASYDPAAIFEEQLKKCDVEYFDFYLLHNVYENSLSTYTDPRWGIVDYFIKQKEMGRLRHLGFSCHGLQDTLVSFLDKYGDVMEFCQIQLNYLDWTLQDAKAKYDLLTERGIAVWVMEPVRGGRLAQLDEASEAKLKAMRPAESAAAWAFRWLQSLPNVKMILSGMSNMAQMEDNVHTFSERKPLSDEESDILLNIAEGMKNSVPCTACRYCCADCPGGLDIPRLLLLYNEMRFSPSVNVGMTIDSLDENRRPQACIGCGKCARICPQKIDIPEAMKEFSAMLEKVPHWEELCRLRDEAARKAREEQGDRRAESRNIYETCPTLENGKFLLRLVENEDCDDLLRVYSDKNALPFFNSDNCDGDNFYYATKERMTEALGFWDLSYKNGWFARLSIVDKTVSKVIGTIELCLRVSEDEFNNMGILRIDVRSDYEKEEVLYDIAALITPHLSEMLGCNGIITKVPIYAVERMKAIQKAGFTKSDHMLIGKSGYAYDGYWIRK